MKNTTRTLKLVACALSLTAVVQNCKPSEVDSLTPFTYTFKDLDNIKMPELRQTAPASVSVTAASVTPSPQTAAVVNGLKSIASTGVVPDAVKKAGDDVAKAIPDDKAASLAASFTPEVVNNLASSGTMPASLKAEVAALASNPAVKAYLPTYTLPSVNGVAVGGRLGAVASVLGTQSVADDGTDACKKAAGDAYGVAVGRFEQTRQTQTAAVTASYTSAEAAANSEVASCQSGVPARYDGMVASARQELTANLASLDAGRAVMGDRLYNMLRVLNYVTFSQVIEVYSTLRSADANLCTATKDAKVRAAQIARDADLNTINTNYNAAVTSAQTTRDRAVASCHNQGNGG